MDKSNIIFGFSVFWLFSLAVFMACIVMKMMKRFCLVR